MALVMAIISVGIGVFAGARALSLSGKKSYNVTIVTSAGETHAVTSKNPKYIRKVVGAINEAIIRR